jgi:hypothetical protein
MFRVLSTTAGFFSGEEGLTGNRFSGEESFRGLLIGSEIFCGDCDFDVGDARLFNGFKGEIGSRSGLFAAILAALLGEIFSRSSADSETLATNGELGGPSLSVSRVCVV